MPDKKDTATIKLKHPIERKEEGGAETAISEIRLHRMKLKHLKLLPPSLFEKMEEGGKAEIGAQDIIPILCALTSLDESIIGEIDLEDMVGAADTISDFVERSLAAIGKA